MVSTENQLLCCSCLLLAGTVTISLCSSWSSLHLLFGKNQTFVDLLLALHHHPQLSYSQVCHMRFPFFAVLLPPSVSARAQTKKMHSVERKCSDCSLSSLSWTLNIFTQHGHQSCMNLVLRRLKAEEQKCQWNWHNWKDQSVSSTESDSYMSRVWEPFSWWEWSMWKWMGKARLFLWRIFKIKAKSEIRNDKTPI